MRHQYLFHRVLENTTRNTLATCTMLTHTREKKAHGGKNEIVPEVRHEVVYFYHLITRVLESE